MELHGKNVIPCNGAGKAQRMPAGPSNERLIGSFHVVTVHKIEPTAFRDAIPHRMGHCLINLVPPHVRDLEFFTLAVHGGWKAHDLAGKHSQPGRSEEHT